MEIDFDPAKDKANFTRHGVSLAAAAQMEWAAALIWPDLRRDYGESRMVGIGYIGLRLYFVVFVDRDGCRRIISLRKANRREVQLYAKA